MLETKFDPKEDFFRTVTASQIMIKMTQSDLMRIRILLSKVIDIFERTKFAIVPVMNSIENNASKPAIIGTLTIRDFLPYS